MAGGGPRRTGARFPLPKEVQRLGVLARQSEKAGPTRGSGVQRTYFLGAIQPFDTVRRKRVGRPPITRLQRSVTLKKSLQTIYDECHCKSVEGLET